MKMTNVVVAARVNWICGNRLGPLPRPDEWWLTRPPTPLCLARYKSPPYITHRKAVLLWPQANRMATNEYSHSKHWMDVFVIRSHMRVIGV